MIKVVLLKPGRIQAETAGGFGYARSCQMIAVRGIGDGTQNARDDEHDHQLDQGKPGKTSLCLHEAHLAVRTTATACLMERVFARIASWSLTIFFAGRVKTLCSMKAHRTHTGQEEDDPRGARAPTLKHEGEPIYA